jgi:peptidoglycan/xylan/chitin deacetylase (PgdA/CDA1 family)
MAFSPQVAPADAIAGGDNPESRDTNSRLRVVAASCYVQSGMPSVMRRFRERYQVSLSPTLACERRTHPTGRILTYHAVNDHGDRYFPATRTSVFESHMRYVARYYTVVSLRELMARMEDPRRPDNLVAITFDDGYQDNYLCALPILRRYGLPATIFVTTGPVDTREPLWFETLAEAVQTSRREYLDFEIADRRLWLRTAPERAKTRDTLYAMLRGMPNADREEWLSRILRALGAGDTERRNRMLTWDQMRKMKRHGIDFGGHTVTHPFLSRLTHEEAVWQVTHCRNRIQQELQCKVDHFAYPSGRGQDFSSWNKDILTQAGYRAAFTTIWGVNDPATDRMELRRGGPWEEKASVFGWKLDWYQLLNY